MTLLGHVMRRDSIVNLSLTGNVKGKRARRKQKMTYLDNAKNWANTTNRSDHIWKHMIIDTLGGDTKRRIITNILKEKSATEK